MHETMNMDRLSNAFGSEAATQIMAVVEGCKSPELYESVHNWIRQCYNRPSDLELELHAINEIIGGHGTEAVFQSSDDMEPLFAYVNMGDTYIMTVLYDYHAGEYVCADYGSQIEYLAQNGIEVD